MGQFSMEMSCAPGLVLGGNQQTSDKKPAAIVARDMMVLAFWWKVRQFFEVTPVMAIELAFRLVELFVTLFCFPKEIRNRGSEPLAALVHSERGAKAGQDGKML